MPCFNGIISAQQRLHLCFDFSVLFTGIDKAEKNEDVTVFHAGTRVDGNNIYTSGGRVLAVVATDKNFESAIKRANQAADIIRFEGKQFRRDIGHKALKQ